MQHATGSINSSSGETSTAPTALKVLTASRVGGREGGRTIGPVFSDLDVVSADPHAAVAHGRVPRQHCARRRRRIRAQGSRRARWRAAHGRAIGWWRPRRGTGGVDGPDSEDMPAMPQPVAEVPTGARTVGEVIPPIGVVADSAWPLWDLGGISRQAGLWFLRRKGERGATEGSERGYLESAATRSTLCGQCWQAADSRHIGLVDAHYEPLAHSRARIRIVVRRCRALLIHHEPFVPPPRLRQPAATALTRAPPDTRYSSQYPRGPRRAASAHSRQRRRPAAVPASLARQKRCCPAHAPRRTRLRRGRRRSSARPIAAARGSRRRSARL